MSIERLLQALWELYGDVEIPTLWPEAVYAAA